MSRRDPAPRRAEPTDDAALARAAAGGNQRALETLLERHFDLIHAVCRRVTGHPDDALDATQEALISMSRHIGRWDERARFTTWLYRVATNAALDELRRRKRRPVPSDSLAEPTGAAFESGVDARLDVDAALTTLSPEFRAAVVLRDLCDLEYDDIAEVLDVPIGTVRSRIARGRAAIAEELGNRSGDSDRPMSRES
ncbi:MAG TPA: RNA polymerase sigma factor [Acidimicrobiia bacterium]|nr:RNA polymerase sigma factor [Acidimicrobiia bacterium]